MGVRYEKILFTVFTFYIGRCKKGVVCISGAVMFDAFVWSIITSHSRIGMLGLKYVRSACPTCHNLQTRLKKAKIMKICHNSNDAAQKDNEIFQKVKLDTKQCLAIRSTIDACFLGKLSNIVYFTDQILGDFSTFSDLQPFFIQKLCFHYIIYTHYKVFNA